MRTFGLNEVGVLDGDDTHRLLGDRFETGAEIILHISLHLFILR